MKNMKKINAKKWRLLMFLGMLSYGSTAHASSELDELQNRKDKAKYIYNTYIGPINYKKLKFGKGTNSMKKLFRGMLIGKKTVSPRLLKRMDPKKHITKDFEVKYLGKDKTTGKLVSETYKLDVVDVYKLLAPAFDPKSNELEDEVSPTHLGKKENVQLQTFEKVTDENEGAFEYKDIISIFKVMMTHFGGPKDGANEGFMARMILDGNDEKFKEIMGGPGKGFGKIFADSLDDFVDKYSLNGSKKEAAKAYRRQQEDEGKEEAAKLKRHTAYETLVYLGVEDGAPDLLNNVSGDAAEDILGDLDGKLEEKNIIDQANEYLANGEAEVTTDDNGISMIVPAGVLALAALGGVRYFGTETKSNKEENKDDLDKFNTNAVESY